VDEPSVKRRDTAEWRILDLAKGGKTRGSGGLLSPAGPGAEPQRSATFCDYDANFEAY